MRDMIIAERRMTMTTKSITSGQRKQIIRFGIDSVENVLEESNLGKDGAQRVIERGDEFAAHIRKATLEGLKKLSIGGLYVKEELVSGYTYPDGYKVREIAEQVRILREFFPGIGNANEKIAKGFVPSGAEGWFAIPRWQTLATTYCDAVGMVLEMIESKRSFHNYCWRQLGASFLRQNAKTARAFEKLGNEQQDRSILVVPAQFGLRHGGRSVHRAREVFSENEFGLGTFAVGCMLLTHPEREERWQQLHVECAGDEFCTLGDDNFGNVPVFFFSDERIVFTVRCGADVHFGSVSGFLSASSADRP
jgi:hypothetical protein